MNLLDAVRTVFDPEGELARSVDGFCPRAGQTEMALAVARAIENRGVLVVEAGTGVGKTFAYLVPALLSAERVLLSTATKTLQDQLYRRDLPRLIAALALPVRTALLKGRSSYLCLHRLSLAREDPSLSNPLSVHALARVEQWAQQTRSGDLAELPGLDERSPVIPLVTSTRENCLGSNCPKFRDCHVNLARREALAADVVVINHHLFFADLAVRESGMAELLPSVRTVIFDEAHQLNETGVQFLGRQLSTAQALDFGRDLLACGLQQARGLVDWTLLAASVDRAARDLRLCAGRAQGGARLAWTDLAPDTLAPEIWAQSLEALGQACRGARDALKLVDEMGPDFVRLHERANALVELSVFFQSERAMESVRWLDVGSQLRLVESPLDIAQAVQTRMLAPPESGQSSRSWIFTSATLGDDAKLSWFTEPCGMEDAEIVRVESPFDYARQSTVFVPSTLPKPADPRHSQHVAELAGRLASELGGRTLVLTTTLRAMRAISAALHEQTAVSGRLQILTQGQSSKMELLDRFRQGVHGQSGCILVASASFWEGVDIPGEALQLVIIDKLPFPPPNDPLVQARSQRLEQKGRSAFKDYFVPEAAVALKQGAGRLIRRESDQGMLVICDTRLSSMGYGRRLLSALPPMRRLADEAQAIEALQVYAAGPLTNPA